MNFRFSVSHSLGTTIQNSETKGNLKWLKPRLDIRFDFLGYFQT